MAQYLSAQDYADYGSDLVTFAKKAALESVAPHIENLQNQNYALRDHLAQESRRSLDLRVAALVPDYLSIDQRPDWHNWLRGTDSLSGQPRQSLLDNAIANRDAHRVANFFRQFQREAGAGGASPSSGQQSFPSGRIYSRADIAKIYDSHRRNRYSEAQWKQLEADIFAAQRAGRIKDFDYVSK
jgi:hypothetical protein